MVVYLIVSRSDGDAMLAAGAVTYFGPFSAESRAKFMDKWKDPGCVKRTQSFITEGIINRSPGFDFLSLMRPKPVSGVVSHDTHTLENVLILRLVTKSPLLLHYIYP